MAGLRLSSNFRQFLIEETKKGQSVEDMMKELTDYDERNER